MHGDRIQMVLDLSWTSDRTMNSIWASSYQGPSLSFPTTAFGSKPIEESENIDAWNCLGTLPFPSIALGSEAIKGAKNIDT